MKRSDVSALLAGKLRPSEFEATYSEELETHAKLLGKKGSSRPILLEGDESIFLDRDAFFMLMKKFSEDEISKELLSYLLDALSLDARTRFTHPAIRELVMNLSDMDIDKREVNFLLKECSLFGNS
ncbi:MAG: hypothetical protein E6Q88_08930 [Lysobacteraceae bacterium]|nr:MAG: hypothetical protein E6Q88_08930 [Xanthomonadaceae bacterium]